MTNLILSEDAKNMVKSKKSGIEVLYPKNMIDIRKENNQKK